MTQQNATILNGNALAKKIRASLKENISTLRKKPGLAIILIGRDEPSHMYVRLKKKACEEVDINIHQYLFTEEATQKEILETMRFLNQDDDIHGMIVQLPLPKKFNESAIIKAIAPKKDVDGFHPLNTLAIKQGKPKIIPGLALAIMRLIKSADQPIEGKNAIIVSNSKIFSAPLVYLLSKEGVEARYTSPKNTHTAKKISEADIIIIAVGKPKFIKKTGVKDNAIIIDVGINRTKHAKITGDVDTAMRERNVFLTPVPGGVGPVTVAMLLYNTYLLAKKDTENQG